MYEPTEFTDEGIRKWAAEQNTYAIGISKDDLRHSGAILILEHAGKIQMKLTRPTAEAEQRRHRLVAEKIAKWRKDRHGYELPLEQLNEEAYRESRPDIMTLVQEITDLRTQAEALPRREGRAKGKA